MHAVNLQDRPEGLRYERPSINFSQPEGLHDWHP